MDLHSNFVCLPTMQPHSICGTLTAMVTTRQLTSLSLPSPPEGTSHEAGITFVSIVCQSFISHAPLTPIPPPCSARHAHPATVYRDHLTKPTRHARHASLRNFPPFPSKLHGAQISSTSISLSSLLLSRSSSNSTLSSTPS